MSPPSSWTDINSSNCEMKRPYVEVTEEDVRGFRGMDLIYSRKHKLIICAIPKVACTEWVKLMLLLHGQNISTPRTRVWDMFTKTKHMKMGSLSPQEATKIMNDPKWKRVVFLRDPVKRLMSGHLDKIVNVKGWAVENMPGLDENSDFHETVNYLWDKMNGTTPMRLPRKHLDPHFWLQVEPCKLWKFMPLYDFIGSHENVSAHGHLLLRELGLWEEYGSHGWPGPEDHFLPPTSHARHKTNSSEEVRKVYTPELEERVGRIYKPDYEMIQSLGLTPARPIFRRACTEEERRQRGEDAAGVTT